MKENRELITRFETEYYERLKMDLEKTYHDIDGNPCNILRLVKLEPIWAAVRIQGGGGNSY